LCFKRYIVLFLLYIEQGNLLIPRSYTTPMRQLFLVLIIFILSLLGLVALFNTLTNSSKQSNIVLATDWPDYPTAEEHLVEALRWRSSADSIGRLELVDFYTWIRQRYPLLFDNPNLEWKEFGTDNWVAKWIGRKADLAPIVWMASPEIPLPKTAALATASSKLPSQLDATSIRGRGSRGSKVAMMAMLEVLHQLLSEERLPDRTIYFAFPFPAQVGEARILTALAQAGTPAAYVLQTGSGIAENLLWDLEAPVALLGVGQLAQAQITLKRMAPTVAWDVLAQRLAKNLPAADLKHPVAKQLLHQLSPELPFGQRFVFSNTWLLNWKQRRYFAPASFSNSLVGLQTHLVPTTVHSDTAQLHLTAPQLPAALLVAVQALLKMDSVQVLSNWTTHEGFASAEMQSRYYRLIGNTCKEVFPRVLTAPIWVARAHAHSAPLIQAPTFYFHPVQLEASNWVAAPQGFAESISRQNYKRLLHFYHQLLSNSI
jgi:hypothetical protein